MSLNLLLDANISWRLVKELSPFADAVNHVDLIGLTIPAKDGEIWDYAKENNFIIISNDAYFLDILNWKGFPPKVVLLKTGNQSNFYLLSLIIKHIADIIDLSKSKDIGLLEIY